MLYKNIDSFISSHSSVEKEMQMVITIIKALEDGRIISHYQPIVCNKKQSIVRYEALVRLVGLDGTILYPKDFLYIAKKGRYYDLITQKVLEDAFEKAANHDIQLSVNISLDSLQSSIMQSIIRELINRYSDVAKNIIFEILEDKYTMDLEEIFNFIDEIKEKGIKIAIDDFGAGCSNYKRLLKFKPDIVKLDESLIQNINTDKVSHSIVKSIVTFTKEQNIKTTAEYVATKEIYEAVKELGVDYSQGYYFSKPLGSL